MIDIDLRVIDGKDFEYVIKFAEQLAESNLEGKIHAHKVLNLVLDQVPANQQHPNPVTRGFINQKLWDLERELHWNQRYFSQSGQDKAIYDRFFKGRLSKGFFVELGAYDGVIGSNTLFFERFMGWQGIAVEGSKAWYDQLIKNRSCECIQAVVSSQKKKVSFVEVTSGLTQMSGIESDNFLMSHSPFFEGSAETKIRRVAVDTLTLKEILTERQRVDYLSLDVEGEEMPILESLDFKKISIGVVSVENNLPESQDFHGFFSKNNYKYFDRFGSDEVFYNKSFFN